MKLKRILAIAMALCLSAALSISAFASASGDGSGGGTATFETSVKPLFDKILAQLNVTNIVALLAGVIGSGIVFVFLWWAIRKGISVLMSAIRKGKVSS